MTKQTNKPARAAKPAVAAIAPETNATVTTTAVADGKMAKAKVIFDECMAQSPVPARKDILARFQSEAGCTKAGAGTYLQILKGRAGLVQHKAKPASTESASA